AQSRVIDAMPLDRSGRTDALAGFTMSDRPTSSVVLLVADDPGAATDLELRLTSERAGSPWALSIATCATAPAIARQGTIDIAIVEAEAADLIDVVRDLRRAAPTMAVVAIAPPHEHFAESDLLRAGAQEVLAGLPPE